MGSIFLAAFLSLQAVNAVQMCSPRFRERNPLLPQSCKPALAIKASTVSLSVYLVHRAKPEHRWKVYTVLAGVSAVPVIYNYRVLRQH